MLNKVTNKALKKQKDHLKIIAHLGGLARVKKYGNPGTVKGRSLGGKNSIKSNSQLNNGFKKAIKIKKPKQTDNLAELLGIMVGDGHLSKYQATVTTNLITDMEHALFIKKLFLKIFNIEPVLQKRPQKGAIVVVVSSVGVAKILEELGMPKGNKLSSGLKAPAWVVSNKNFSKRFLRGLIDTDGCVYLDHHKIKNKDYYHVGLNFCSCSAQLREDVVKIFKSIGLNPTCKNGQNSVFLRKQREIEIYFKLVGSSNPKHLNRYKEFAGRVPKRS